MAQLYNVDSPINREQRNNLNATFTDILNRFSNLRYQISILAGGEDLEVILQRIEDAVTNANNTTANTQQVLDDISDALNQLSTALQNSDNAADNANDAATNAQNEISNMQNYVNQLGNAETYDNSKTYSKNNIAEYNGSSFIALQQTTGNAPPTLPTKRNDFWQLLAQRGVDGTGSVSSVNNQSPDVNGNVQLTPGNIGAATEVDLTNLSQSVSTLSTEVTKHLENYATTQDVTYYVDATNGNDNNDGLSSGTAFKTINKAIGKIPNFVNNAVTLNIANGDYNERVLLTGKAGGREINIRGNQSKVLSLEVSGNQVTVNIDGIEATSTDTDGFSFANNAYVFIINCVCTTQSNLSAFIFKTGSYYITNSMADNRIYGCNAETNATVLSSTWDNGMNNQYGLRASLGAKISKIGVQPNGSVAEIFDNGGVIQ